MSRSRYVLPLAALLVTAYPVTTLADDAVDECRRMAAEEEVAAEDMEDYIAECLAVIQSAGSEDAAEAMDEGAAGPEGEEVDEAAEEAEEEAESPAPGQRQ